MITKPKGTRDLYGTEAKKWQYVNDLIDSLCEKYNYHFIRTPVFEASELFHRGVGETTDIVTKETYDFIDRGERPMTLRCEGTAGVVRSYIENKMYGLPMQPLKFYYNETIYRYERPQSGRFREHTQFGVEVLGSDDAYIDAEVISLAVNLFKMLGLKGIKVHVNSLGDKSSRENYKKILTEYLRPHISSLCGDCQRRFEVNPLRVIDCKVDMDSSIIKNAPLTIDNLNKESKDRFTKVQDFLDVLDIEYVINPKIVRGLDYYNHTIFEISAEIKDFGAQNVLCGGGRYNGLVESLDGPSTPGIGFGMGLDRLHMALKAEGINLPIKNSLDCYIMYVNPEEKEYAALISQDLRLNGYTVDMDYMNKSLKAQFREADRLNVRYLIILNSEDIKNEEVTLKDNTTKEEVKVKINSLIDQLDMNF